MRNLYIFMISILLHNQDSLASKVQGQIHSLVSTSDEKHHILRFRDGRAVLIKKEDLPYFKMGKINSYRINLETDQNNYAVSFSTTGKTQAESSEFDDSGQTEFEPTILPGMKEAQELFERLNTKYKRRSECSNRAHIWSYEEFKKNNVKLSKIWLFFTANYIAENRFNWWFHVAPTVLIRNSESTEEIVLDYRYMPNAAKIEDWKNLFVFSGRPCVLVTKFSEYDHNPHTEHCYFMKTNMYTWMPDDLVREEQTGYIKNKFYESDIKSAYRMGFQ